jgi:hypothetical protein
MTIGSSLTAASPNTSRWLIPVLVIGFALAMAVFSRGFLEPDEITHFLYARAVGHDWRLLVNIWGRLGATGLYAPGAPLGPLGPRLVAVGVMALTGWGTSVLLGHFVRGTREGFFGRHATAWAWLLLMAQPCYLLNSFTVMTEMPLACAWVWALVALVCRRSVVLAGILMGIGGLMRPEGWVAVAGWPVFLVLVRGGLEGGTDKRDMFRGGEKSIPQLASGTGRTGVPVRPVAAGIVLSTVLAWAPMAGWYLLGVAAWRDWGWFVAQWPWRPASQYGRSGLLFMISTLTALAVWMWVPVAAGGWFCWKSRDQSRAGLMVLVLPVVGFFMLHGTLGALGLFGSMSLPRYFVAVAPLLAVLGAMGLMQLEVRGGKVLCGAVVMLALAPPAGLMALGYLPMRSTVEERRLEVVVQAVRARGVDEGRLIAGHPYVLLRLGLDPDSPAFVRASSREALAQAPAGTLLIADTTVWFYEGRATAEELRRWGYHEDSGVAAQVAAVAERFEPLTIKAAGAGAARVGLWVKEQAAAGGQ